MSETNIQTAGSTETKIVKMSNGPPLVNEVLVISPGTSF